MIIKLSSIDILQISKALKSGRLDLDKIDTFKSLVEGYNPPKTITDKELSYYLECLYKGYGYIPTPRREIEAKLLSELNREQLEKWKDGIEDGSIYKQLVRRAFIGMVAVKGLGGTFEDVNPDFSFMESPTAKDFSDE